MTGLCFSATILPVATKHSSTKKSILRIIGGKWRGRKISFIPFEQLRPTTDATRETLFNWLSPHIVGANCLDMFAGSGALGFEALSRGAEHVTMVDTSRKIIEQLRKNAKLLQTDTVNFHWARMPERLNGIPEQKFDIIFIDPPFHFGLVKLSCTKLENSSYLHDHTLIYIECERDLPVKDILAPLWQILREKKSGLTGSYLCRRDCPVKPGNDERGQ